MTSASQPPFSARYRGEATWVEDDFPFSARNGLFHLLNDLVDRNYLPDWSVPAKELRRSARASVREYHPRSVPSMSEARDDAEAHLQALEWAKVYDFCERLYSHLVQRTEYDTDGDVVSASKPEAQKFLAEELQRLFSEERLGYEFADGLVQRRGKRHTLAQITKADAVLFNHGLNAARKHFSKAIRHFRDREKPDYENAVKEAVCAVEAAAKGLFPEAKTATLGDFAKWATGNQPPLLPKPLGHTLTGLYGFRNSGEGVSHGATAGGAVTPQLAEYVLGVAASQVILLASLVRDEEEPPF